MSDPALPRRRALQLGAVSVVPALAGCLEDDSDRPWYAAWLPRDDVTFAGVTLPQTDRSDDGPSLLPAVLPQVGNSSSGSESQEPFELSGIEDLEDPLVAFPFKAGATTVGLSVLGLAATDLPSLLDRHTEFATEPEGLLVVNGTVVITGEIDREEIDERLTGEPAPFTAAYERTGTLADESFERYDPDELPADLDRAPVVAVGERAIVVGTDLQRLERVLNRASGDRSSGNDEHDGFAWLIARVGAGDVVAGTVGSPPVEPVDPGAFSDAEPSFEPTDGESVLAAVEIDPEQERLEAQFALTGDAVGEGRQEAVASAFGSAARDRSIDRRDDRIAASGTYDLEAIDVELSEPTDREQLIPEEASELVPEDALASRYVPPIGDGYGRFWVDVRADTEAAAIRVEADSGGTNETGPREGTVEAGLSIATQVDPNGDAVTLFAVDEREALGEIATHEVPTDELSETAARQAVPPEALSFRYEPPTAGNLGRLTVAVQADTNATVLALRPRKSPAGLADRAGSLGDENTVEAGTTLDSPVDPDGDEVVVFATVDKATGPVARWTGPG